MAKKPPDDNDLRRAGRLSSYLDGVEPDQEAAPASTPPPSGPLLLSAEQATAAILAALASPAPLLALPVTPGSGKSAMSRQCIAAHVAVDGRAIVAVPTHDLAAQTAEGLARLGVGATAPMGVARVRLRVIRPDGDATNEAACVYADEAELLARSGAHVRRVLCDGCSYRDQHPTGGECPAFAAGADKAPVVVLQQQLLSATLADQAERLRAGDEEAARLAVLDERIPPTTTTDLAGALADWRAVQGELADDVRERLGPLLEAALDGAARAPNGGTLAELVALGGRDRAYLDAALADARALDGARPWARGVLESWARLVQTAREAGRQRLDRAARVTALVDALVDAAHTPDRAALWVDEAGTRRLMVAARWGRRVRSYVEAGGRVRVLDATAPIAALRALLGPGLEVASVDVADAPGLVERRFLLWTHGARGRHTLDGHVQAEVVRGPLRRLALICQDRGARSVGILTHKPLAEALRAWLAAPANAPAPELVPAELVELVDAGVELRVGHYGAQRGLDAWAACDVLATLGDPWPNLGASCAEALALGIDPATWALEQTRAELVQAWGRARAVHRTTPVLVVHLGTMALAPDASWAPQWAGVRPEQPARGRPRSVRPATDPSTWAEERAARGLSARQHAAALRLDWRTYRRLAPQGSVEEGDGSQPNSTIRPPKNPDETPGHNPPLGKTASSPSSITDYAPPKTPVFVASGQPETSSTGPDAADAPEPPPAPASGPRARPWMPAEADAAPVAPPGPRWGLLTAGALGAPLGAPGRGAGGAWVA